AVKTTNPQSPTTRGAPSVCWPTPQSGQAVAGRNSPRSWGQPRCGMPMGPAPQTPLQPAPLAQGQARHWSALTSGRQTVAGVPQVTQQRLERSRVRPRPLDLAAYPQLALPPTRRRVPPLSAWQTKPRAIPIDGFNEGPPAIDKDEHTARLAVALQEV